MMTACTTVLRGAGYVALDGGVPAHSDHSALASPYAHATAPLRRLVDRYVGEPCLALCAGTPVQQWVRDARSEALRVGQEGCQLVYISVGAVSPHTIILYTILLTNQVA